MPELRGFWEFDDSDEELAPEVQEVVDFLAKMDSEGGLDAMIAWGGYDAFPPAVRDEAQLYALYLENLQNAIETWANANGIAI